MSFTGFSPAVAPFFDGLARNNSRDYFQEHRDDYEQLVRQPMEDLLAEAEALYGPGKVTRPNRDIRFSNDKSLYRTDSSMWAGHVGGIYLRVASDGVMAGGGLYDPDPKQLARAREAIATRPTAAARLASLTESLTQDGFELAGPFVATAPRGYSSDDPNIDLLRLKRYAASTALPLTTGAAAIFSAWARSRPLVDWVLEYAGRRLED